ncbi:hypothetical protein [Chryseolinea lacunae]|uniref:Uncharacterized protein n=1 Tax=Chryseolinea lacunae TaxID=2801331 RepID=A0ABS1L2J6_9BACT|nr:hypothetical protein [Chryseolinea lacunae]MBL0745936.1 hypothetical protein [Chryseolinea lacunae]
MKRSVTIELLEEHKNATFYTLRFTDEADSEFEKFWAKFSKSHSVDCHLLSYWMERIGNEGTSHPFFRDEGGVFVKAIPFQPSNLRLYCYIIERTFLLFGGGGKKNTRTFQDDPILNEQVNFVRKTGNKILRYLDKDKIMVDGNKLTGKLTFDIKL